MKKEIKIFCAKDWSIDSAQDKLDYEMLDTGEGEKLERFGPYTFVRPSESVMWKKTLSEKEWEKADGKFWSSKTGAKAGWKFNHKIESKWVMEYKPARNAFSIADAGGGLNGEVISGELCLLEKSNKRNISLSNTAIWEKN